jgi:hypothetical protein
MRGIATGLATDYKVRRAGAAWAESARPVEQHGYPLRRASDRSIGETAACQAGGSGASRRHERWHFHGIAASISQGLHESPSLRLT